MIRVADYPGCLTVATERNEAALFGTVSVLTHLEKRQDAYEQSHQRIHDLENALMIRTAADLERRLSVMNELRAQIDGERGSFVSRDMMGRETSGATSRA